MPSYKFEQRLSQASGRCGLPGGSSATAARSDATASRWRFIFPRSTPRRKRQPSRRLLPRGMTAGGTSSTASKAATASSWRSSFSRLDARYAPV
jgi:hypothetical protein